MQNLIRFDQVSRKVIGMTLYVKMRRCLATKFMMEAQKAMALIMKGLMPPTTSLTEVRDPSRPRRRPNRVKSLGRWSTIPRASLNS